MSERDFNLPLCGVCGEDYITVNTYMVYKVELFCANDKCPDFVKTFWAWKEDLRNE